MIDRERDEATTSGEHYRFFTCLCEGEAVAVSHAWWDKDDVEIYLSMWQSGGRGWNHSWRERLRQIWRIIRRGYPYLDDVSLTPTQARELGEKLIELSKGER
jgi:hypothetical protein